MAIGSEPEGRWSDVRASAAASFPKGSLTRPPLISGGRTQKLLPYPWTKAVCHRCRALARSKTTFSATSLARTYRQALLLADDRPFVVELFASKLFTWYPDESSSDQRLSPTAGLPTPAHVERTLASREPRGRITDLTYGKVVIHRLCNMAASDPLMRIKRVSASPSFLNKALALPLDRTSGLLRSDTKGARLL